MAGWFISSSNGPYLFACVFNTQHLDGKENSMTNGWESQLNRTLLEQSRQKILQILNTGSLKDLKGLQQIGDKKSKLIQGWRQIHGHFTTVSMYSQINM